MMQLFKNHWRFLTKKQVAPSNMENMFQKEKKKMGRTKKKKDLKRDTKCGMDGER